MKKLITIITTILLIANSASAQPQKCIATLAGVKYPALVRTIPNDYSIKVFYETFGNAKNLIEQEFAAGRMKVGVNGLWEDSHNFGDQHIPKIRTIGKDLQDLLNKYPGREIKFRPFTEHKIARPDKYLDIAQQACPSCIIVNSNWQGGFTRNTKYQNEVHGSKDYPKDLLQRGVKYNFDYDGTNSHDSDRKSMGEKHSSAEEFCDWTFDLNLKISEKDKTPRPNRIHMPTQRMIRALMFYSTVAKGTHNDFPNKQWIFKHCAERHTPWNGQGKDPEPRACTPVIIAPANGKQLVCQMSNGKKLFSLDNKGLYQDKKRFVYRPPTFDNWGFQYANESIKATGSPICTLFLDGKRVAKVNPGWRDNDYRS